MKYAVLGASGIGKYHFRELQALNCEVVAILGKTDKTAKETAESLGKIYKKKVNSYSDLNKLLDQEKIRGVIVATPAETHYDFVKLCLLKGINVFCEKPLVSKNIYRSTKELLEIAKERKVVLGVNNQWPAFLKNVEIPKKIISFSVSSEPGSQNEDLLFDHLSHANSLLVRLIPRGSVKDIALVMKGRGEIGVSFVYQNSQTKCLVEYSFRFKEDRPRKLSFSINGEVYERIIGENYQQSILNKGKVKAIEDPLSVSVMKFVEAVEQGGETLTSEEEILENAALQEEIMREYHSFISKLAFQKK